MWKRRPTFHCHYWLNAMHASGFKACWHATDIRRIFATFN